MGTDIWAQATREVLIRPQKDSPPSPSLLVALRTTVPKPTLAYMGPAEGLPSQTDR